MYMCVPLGKKHHSGVTNSDHQKLGPVLTVQQDSASPGRNASGHIYEDVPRKV